MSEKLCADLLSLEALLVARAYLYELYHKAFGGEPSQQLLECITDPVTYDALDEYAAEDETCARLRDFTRQLDSKAACAGFLDSVRAEYSLFFQGPSRPPAFPWESPYVAGEETVFQLNTLQVREAYRAQGLQVRRLYHMPDDHISLMCAFMAEMSRRALGAFRAADAAGLEGMLRVQASFARQHMNNWLPRYAEGSLHVAAANLYPQLIQGVKAFVAIDEGFVAQAIEWVASMRGNAGFAGAAWQSTRRLEFEPAEQALNRMCALDLRGIEDNELVPVAELGSMEHT